MALAARSSVDSASSHMLGLAMLRADPHAWRLDQAAQSAAVDDALADGTATAQHYRRRYPHLTVSEIARELSVTISVTDDDPMVSSIWRFAEYRPRPPHILLYTRGLAPLEEARQMPLVRQLLGDATPHEVFIAHEIYHHAEAIRPDVPIARRNPLALLKIGRLRWSTGLAAMAEIAAGAFAQSLLALPCHPKALDSIVLSHARARSVTPTTSE